MFLLHVLASCDDDIILTPIPHPPIDDSVFLAALVLPTGGDRIRHSQSFEQQGTDAFSDIGRATGESPSLRGVFLGGGVSRTDGRSNRSMRSKVASSPMTAQLAAVEAAEAVGNKRGREAGERGASYGDDEVEDVMEQEWDEGYDASVGDGNGAPAEVEAGGSEEASAVTAGTVLLLPPQLRRPSHSHSPLSSPPPPPPPLPGAGLAFVAEASNVTDSGRPMGTESGSGYEELTAGMGALPATVGDAAVFDPATGSPGSVLRRLAMACRLSGVVFVSCVFVSLVVAGEVCCRKARTGARPRATYATHLITGSLRALCFAPYPLPTSRASLVLHTAHVAGPFSF